MFPEGTSSAAAVPVIDLRNLLLAGETKDFELQKLHSTCKEWGMFQLVSHGVRYSLLEKLKHEIQEFYKLPLEKRMSYGVKPGDVEGYSNLIPHSEGQEVEWAHKFYMLTNPIRRRKPHLFPQLPSSLREIMEAYISELQKIAMTLLGLMAEALNLDKGEMNELFEDGMQSIRMTCYPPCLQPEKVTGIRAHSDGTAITILLQINEVEGLQVKKDGVWMPVKFLPDAFVVNVGDVLEMLSNGIYISAEHRATVNSATERMSIGMFFFPKLEAEIGPSPRLVSEEHPPLYKTLAMENFLKSLISRKHKGKSHLDLMRTRKEQINTI